MFTKKIMAILGAIVTVLSLLGGIWAFDKHYATNEEVTMKIERVEIEVASALQKVQIKTDYKFYQFMYDKLTQDMYDMKRQLRENPNDEQLKEDYRNVVNQRKEIKKKMENLMREID